MSTTDSKSKFNVKGSMINNERTVKLLGITLNNKLSFEPHPYLVLKG